MSLLENGREANQGHLELLGGHTRTAGFDINLIALSHGSPEFDSPRILANNANLLTPFLTLLGLLN